jgi:hypothetical protein
MGAGKFKGEEDLLINEEHFHFRVHHKALRGEFYADILGMHD